MTLFSRIPHDTLRQEHKIKTSLLPENERCKEKKKKLQCQWKLHTEFGIKSKSKVKET